MQYNLSVAPKAIGVQGFEVPIADIRAAFAQVADPRRKEGTRYPLYAMLTLAVAGLLCNHLSVSAIAEWAADLEDELKVALGFTKAKTPCQTTLHRLFARLNPAQLARALTNYFDPNLPSQIEVKASQGVALDGKCQRGRLKFEAEASYPCHALSAFCHETGLVLAQVAIDNQVGESELSQAPQLIKQIQWEGRVLTGDAIFCQKNLCKQVVEAGGDYLFSVKGNQGNLQAELEVLFDLKLIPAGLAFDMRRSRTIEKGHGRIEIRQALASSELAGISQWPYLGQVLEVTRKWWQKGEQKTSISYAVTSLAQFEAGVERLMELKRGHWSIENSLHYVKDVTMGEDRSLIHVGEGPDVMSLFRNASVSAIRRSGQQQIAQQLRANCRQPKRALALLGLLKLNRTH